MYFFCYHRVVRFCYKNNLSVSLQFDPISNLFRVNKFFTDLTTSPIHQKDTVKATSIANSFIRHSYKNNASIALYHRTYSAIKFSITVHFLSDITFIAVWFMINDSSDFVLILQIFINVNVI